MQEGDARLMVAGGFDSLITWLDVLGFALLGALTTEYNDSPSTASRPVRARPLRLRARRGRGGGRAGGAGGGARARGDGPRRARGLRLEHERLPHDRRAAGRRRHDRWRWTPRCGTSRGSAGEWTTWSRTEPARRATTCARPIAIKRVFGDGRAAAGRQLAEVDDRPPDLRRRGRSTCWPRCSRCATGSVPPTINVDDPDPRARPGLRPEPRARDARAGGDAERLRLRGHERLDGGAPGDGARSALTERSSARRWPLDDLDRILEVDPEKSAGRSATSRTPSRSSTATSRASTCCRAC